MHLYSFSNRFTNFKEILNHVSWIHSFPLPRDQSRIWSLSMQWDIKKELIPPHQRKVKKLTLNMLLHFSDLAPIQIHYHAYNLDGIYSEKTGYRHKWHKLYFTQLQATDKNGLVFKCCILHKIIVSYIKKFPNLYNFWTFHHLE
jgi:hypothetical protein